MAYILTMSAPLAYHSHDLRLILPLVCCDHPDTVCCDFSSSWTNYLYLPDLQMRLVADEAQATSGAVQHVPTLSLRKIGRRCQT